MANIETINRKRIPVLVNSVDLRDGHQQPYVLYDKNDKVIIARQLMLLGVNRIEAGMGITHPLEAEAIRAVAREVKGIPVASLARAVPGDIDAAWESVRYAEIPAIHVFLSTSDIHLIYQLRKNQDEVIDMAVQGVKRAKSYVDDVEFSPMDATRTPRKFLYRMLESVIQAGATSVNIADTVGYTDPVTFERLIRGIFRNVPNIGEAVVSVHCHNDLGLAVANSLAAVKAGARVVEVCVNGTGERAGNTNAQEFSVGLAQTPYYRDRYYSSINHNQIMETSLLVSRISGVPIHPNAPLVGGNAYTHESGIHGDAVLKNKRTFENTDAEFIGRTDGSNLTLGPTNGTATIDKIAREVLEPFGIQLPPELIAPIYRTFQGYSLTEHRVARDQDYARQLLLDIALKQLGIKG